MFLYHFLLAMVCEDKKIGAYSKLILGTNNVPLINPDNISAIGLALLFSALFGAL
nr:hypothetical protein [Mycoplasmopsis bovis]